MQTVSEPEGKKSVEQMKNDNYFLLYRNTLPGGLFAFSFMGFAWRNDLSQISVLLFLLVHA